LQVRLLTQRLIKLIGFFLYYQSLLCFDLLASLAQIMA